MGVTKQRPPIYLLLTISDIGSAGVVLLLLTTKIGPFPTSGPTAVQAGVFVFIVATILTVFWGHSASSSELIVSVFYSYFVFSILTGLVFLSFYTY